MQAYSTLVCQITNLRIIDLGRQGKMDKDGLVVFIFFRLQSKTTKQVHLLEFVKKLEKTSTNNCQNCHTHHALLCMCLIVKL
jgi:hypothetical protein